uniref:Ground-like domain-containing protein n=1 Tax=Syphacia muris TaxID=451379 RepID=A0A0N5ATZ7_9BILA
MHQAQQFGVLPSTTITTLIIRCEPVRPRGPQCYKTKANFVPGFICCNKMLENLMHVTFEKLKTDGRLNGCNSQILANSLQAKAEATFNTSFEAISAKGNFASKVHFYGSYLCKLKKDGRYVLSIFVSEQKVVDLNGMLVYVVYLCS